MTATASTAPPAPGDQSAARMGYLLAKPTLSVAEAVEVTGLSESTLKRAVTAGTIPVHRIGARVLIATADVLAFVGAAEAPW